MIALFILNQKSDKGDKRQMHLKEVKRETDLEFGIRMLCLSLLCGASLLYVFLLPEGFFRQVFSLGCFVGFWVGILAYRGVA